MPRKKDDPTKSNRRRFLKTAGLAITSLALPGMASAKEGKTTTPEQGQGSSLPSEFYVEGTQTIRTEVTPDEIIRHVQKRSPSLKTRYGLKDPVLEETERIDRENPEEDGLPKRKTYTETRPWKTYYATEEEWSALYNGDAEAAASADTEFSIMASQDPAEDNHPYGVYEYNKVSGGYDVEAPMNIISPHTIPDVAQTLDSNGWTLAVIQHDRWAWNSDSNQFEKQHKSAATSTDGTLGRKHIRMWEFGDYVSGSAHVDSAFPHRATSFDDAEAAVEQVFDNASGWSGYDDWYHLDNGGSGMLDHDGEATKLSKD